MEQKSLFNILEFGDAPKKKRVHYRTPKFTKTYREDINTNDLILWSKLNIVYTQLAYFFPIPLFTETKDYYDFGIVRLWIDKYLTDTYTHENTIYNGQRFDVIQAEIKGTENLKPEQRLYIHELLLERLVNNDENPTRGIENMIERIKRGETLCQLKNSLQI